MTIIDLIRYNHVVRDLYFDTLAHMPWAEVVADKGLSFDSMRNVFLHLSLVEDRWVNYIIPGKFKEWVDLDFNAFKEIDMLKEYKEKIKIRTEAFLTTYPVEKLDRPIVVPWGDKPDTRITIETGLTHMVIEDMIHYGELSAALWQSGLQAPYIGFWRYIHQNQSISKV